MEITKLSDGFTILTAENNGYVHEIGTDTYVKSISVRPNVDINNYEEVGEIPLYSSAEYRTEVERLIALKYTTGQEIQFAREKESAGKAYEEYLAYVEQCKKDAKDAGRYKTDR